jgi:hypothetical protein
MTFCRERTAYDLSSNHSTARMLACQYSIRHHHLQAAVPA